MNMPYDVRPDQASLDNPVLLAMAPIPARRAVAAIWGFDRTIAGIAARAKGNDAILAQLRLAWWREEIAGLAQAKARPDPMLAALAEYIPEGGERALADLIDAWEQLLLTPFFAAADAIGHARKRGVALAALACAILDVDGAARPAICERWAAVDLALHIEDGAIRTALFDHAALVEADTRGAARSLRALDGWSRRIAARRGKPAPLRDQFYLLRMGMIGR